MNFLQRMGRRLRGAWAILRDPDGGLVVSLPQPVVDPRRSADDLRQQARRQGIQDAQNFLYDAWSFGADGDAQSASFDPPFVHDLRAQRAAAIREVGDRQRHTNDKLATDRVRYDEAEQAMAYARQRMANVAAQEALRHEASLREAMGRAKVNLADVPMPPPESAVWEGETVPLAGRYRLLILVFLIAIVFPIYWYVYRLYLGDDFSADVVVSLTLATATLTILAPHLASLLFRGRHATGYDRLLAPLALVSLVAVLPIIALFGFIGARLLDYRVTTVGFTGAARSDVLIVTPVTVIVIFVAVLLLAGLMSFMLGLARRHPFQEAHVLNRRTRDHYRDHLQRRGSRINPDYRGPGQSDADPERIRAIVAAYQAAEEAYFEGLIEGGVDPTFTDAVMRRRGLRRPDPPLGDPNEPPGDPQDPSGGADGPKPQSGAGPRTGDDAPTATEDET